VPLPLRASDTLVLREAPLPSAAVARTMPVHRGTPILFDFTRFQTLEPGQFRVLVDTVVVGRNLGPARYLARSDYYSGRFPREHRRITAAGTMEYLQYRAEGTCFVRMGGAVFEAEPSPLVQQALFELANEMTSWAFLPIAAGAALFVGFTRGLSKSCAGGGIVRNRAECPMSPAGPSV
jgi:hypothetical protein